MASTRRPGRRRRRCRASGSRHGRVRAGSPRERRAEEPSTRRPCPRLPFLVRPRDACPCDCPCHRPRRRDRRAVYAVAPRRRPAHEADDVTLVGDRSTSGPSYLSQGSWLHIGTTGRRATPEESTSSTAGGRLAPSSSSARHERPGRVGPGSGSTRRSRWWGRTAARVGDDRPRRDHPHRFDRALQEARPRTRTSGWSVGAHDRAGSLAARGDAVHGTQEGYGRRAADTHGRSARLRRMTLYEAVLGILAGGSRVCDSTSSAQRTSLPARRSWSRTTTRSRPLFLGAALERPLRFLTKRELWRYRIAGVCSTRSADSVEQARRPGCSRERRPGARGRGGDLPAGTVLGPADRPWQRGAACLA
jgi:hypothetical protein